MSFRGWQRQSYVWIAVTDIQCFSTWPHLCQEFSVVSPHVTPWGREHEGLHHLQSESEQCHVMPLNRGNVLNPTHISSHTVYPGAHRGFRYFVITFLSPAIQRSSRVLLGPGAKMSCWTRINPSIPISLCKVYSFSMLPSTVFILIG